MKTIIHTSNSRGYANHGWLNSYHSFSFANYFDPARIHFGALRVLNDDTVSAARGFGTHSHKNMEIISIPLEGDLEHKDSMGNTTVIKQGDIQIMSAGTGIQHSEYNKNKDIPVQFLQIWIVPNKENVTPRYDQLSMASLQMENEFYQVLSPNAEDQGVWAHQNTWFSMAEFTQKTDVQYDLKKEGNGVYFFVLEGTVNIADKTMNKRDAMGVSETTSVSITAEKGSKILAIEVPMITLN